MKKTKNHMKYLVGFGHHATLSNAGAIVDAVKQGKDKTFLLNRWM